MIPKKLIPFKDFGKNSGEPLITVDPAEMMRFLAPSSRPSSTVKPKWLENYDFSLDGFSDFDYPKPKTKEEEERLVSGFLSGLQKLFDPESNWPFVKMLKLSMDYCVRCQTCNEACHIYVASGRQDIYRPNYPLRAAAPHLPALLHPGGKLLGSFVGADVELNCHTIWRLAGAVLPLQRLPPLRQVCPVGVDNALLTREIRKLFSQEMGIAPIELLQEGHPSAPAGRLHHRHDPGGLHRHDRVHRGRDRREDRQEDQDPHGQEGRRYPADPQRRRVHGLAGEPGGLRHPLRRRGINWTLSSELMGYDAVNYGVWYDDVQFARIALRHVQAAKELGVKKIVVGECGHAHKAICVIADRVLPGDLSLAEIPRESCLPLL